MPAACTLLLLLGLGLVPVPPAGSLPLASPRRLPPPPPPPPPSRNRVGRPSSLPAGSPVIESSHQERSSSTEMRTAGAPVELVTMLAGSREWASLPARHGAVPAASRVTGHTVPPASDGDVISQGAGSPENPSAGTVTHLLTHSHPPDPGSHHYAADRLGRGRRAPSTPAAAEGTPPGSEDVSTDLAEGTQGGHHGLWNGSGFNTMRTVLLPSSPEAHHPGTDSLSQPMSSWVGTELGTAAASPSPSSALPGSLGQLQASSQASSTQTGAEHIMLHPRGVTGSLTSPLLTASPPMDSTFRGVGSSHQPSNSSATERFGSDFPSTSTSISTTAAKAGGRTLRSLPASTRLVTKAEISTSETEISSSSAQSQTPGVSLGAQGDGGRGVTDPLLSDLPSILGSASTTSGSSYEPPRSIPGAEETTDHLDIQAADMSSMAVGTLMSSENGHTAEVTRHSATSSSPTSSLGGTSSSLRTGTHHLNSTWEATDLPGPPLLTSSLSASEGPFPADKASATGGHLSLTSTPGVVGTATREESSTVPVLDTHGASSATGSSAPSPLHTSTLDMVLLSSPAAQPGTQSRVPQSGAGLSELPTKLLPAFSASVSVPSPSATLFIHKEGTPQAPGSHRMWSTKAESLTSQLDTAGDTHTGPVPSSTAWPPVRRVSSGQAGSPEAKVTLSSKAFTYFSAAAEPSTFGSSHGSLSSSGAEKSLSSPITDPVYSSSPSAGAEERMLLSVTGGTLAGGMESSSFHAGAPSSPGPSEPALVEQGRTANASTSSTGFTGFATETVFVRSAKIPTYSSFQNDLTNFSGSHQPVSGSDAEKRTSVSHTDGTYISTTYTRGGERTLLSISNSSTSADSSESSTFFSEISSPFDTSLSSVAHDRQTNASNRSSFVEPSTEPLLVRPSKPSTSASAGIIENTTLVNTASELLTTDRSSLSSSAFPASSSLSSLQHLLSSTPPPTHLFTLSESPEPRLPSVMASSPPLQALPSSLPTSSLPSPSYSLASLLSVFSSPSSISQSSENDQTSTTVATVRQEPSTAATARSSPRETNKPSVTHQPQKSTTFTPTTSPLPTEPMELLGGRVVSMSAPVTVTETASPRDATTHGDSSGKATPLLTTASVPPQTGPTDAPLGPSASAANEGSIVPTVAVTTVKPPVLTTPSGRRPSPGEASTMQDHRAQTPTATKHSYTTGKSTEAMAPTTAKPGKATEENIPVTSPSATPPTIKTTGSIATTLAAAKPTTAPLPSSTVRLRTSPPATEVDKCLSNPCPALATCNNTHGSYICQCPLGYELEKGKCNLVRIFIGQVPLKLNITHGKYTELFHVEREILEVLNASLSGLPGYHHSTVKASREANFVHVSVQSTFSLASNVTFFDVISSVKSYIRACKSPTEACQFISSLKSLHRAGSLCRQKDPECDKETSECTDFDGVALCQCKSGYFKYNKMDHSCRACEDGYKLENETCVSCPFGLGGFNCGNPYQLITVVIAAAGGGLLLIMGIALIVTCCRKNKNDISKLIFKSGDFQMSPYAEYPKNPRAQEWGRETIEMQENGSTKNLLQMTDVYYSPTGLRNPELERNGLFPPYTGLPGSRHSCIYPGQYNPSFISDETRRRDYF
ncbi:protein HEG homolog 1 isoform X6 [Zonotrichia leucophrys gambelii]|uniref:protein HEG homolog 1 isoform X6 n=1 Tax=Zonotrichia leucophrys gambelii TaxID=257770 RepID=UPI0031408770